jgi:hypothetical protein
MVSIFVEQDHASSITSLREFTKNRATANRTHIQNFCLMCEKVTTANNCNIEACQKHFQACLEKKDGQILCRSEDTIKKENLSNYTPPQFTFRSKWKDWICRTCKCPIEEQQLDHVCFISRPEKIDILNENSIWVYDFESAQVEIPNQEAKEHSVNLVCVRKAYENEHGDERTYFQDIETFMEWVLGNTTQERVYIAHNAGRYDVQFVMRYLENNLIPHHFIPAPSSIHAYLSVTIPFGAGNSATFLDFRNYMPGSLKSIGQAFGLEISKGDFPHRFNDGWRDLYNGSIPALEDPRDFWCLDSKKTQEELDEFKSWYFKECELYCTCDELECSCGKLPWNFQSQLLKYCWLDVDVLALAVKKYRDNALAFGSDSTKEENCGWEPRAIDPYNHLTIAQIAMKLLLSGLSSPQMITITPNKVRTERSVLAIGWMERIMKTRQIHIRHIGNSNTEYYCNVVNRFIDGYCRELNEVFVCLNCDFHGCPSCFYSEIQCGTDHPHRPGTFGSVHKDTKEFVEKLFRTYGSQRTHVIWACENDDFSDYELKLGDIMKERDCFYGGRTEAFSPYTKADPDEEIKYQDVCSLYPFICAFKELPIGIPTHISGIHIDRERLLNTTAEDKYFGFIRCQVIPNRQQILGLLPRRDPTSGRLEFPLDPWTGCFGTEELRLAIDNGYQIGEIYEVYHWDKEERSDTALRGYISFFLRMKQESEGWKKLGASSENPSEDEKDIIVEKIYRENGCIARVRKQNVGKNPTKRQLAKIFLNSLWGKFCQKPHKEYFVTIHGYQQFQKIWNDPTIDKRSFSFRHLRDNTWKVKYCTIDAYVKPNAKYNIFLASKVTEWARTILHTEMLRIGPKNILYCDTDSIMFIRKLGAPIRGHGLGEWVDEYPDDKIVKLYVLAPKFYFLLKEDGESLLKSKGVQLTLKNSKRINEERLIQQVLELTFPVVDAQGQIAPFENFIEVENMIIGINSTNSKIAYGTMLTRYTEPKKVRPVYSKREVVRIFLKNKAQRPLNLDEIRRVYTLPHGYFLDNNTVASLLYPFKF